MRTKVTGALFELLGFEDRPDWAQSLRPVLTDECVSKPTFTVLFRRHTLKEIESLTWSLRQLGEEEVAWEDTHTFRVSLDNIFLQFSWEQSRAEISALEDTDVSLAEILGWLNCVVSTHVIYHGGIAIHSSSVANRAGEVTLLLGESGAGKSTLSEQLSGSGSTLHDDYNLIVPTEGGYTVYPSPFATPERALERTDRSGPLRRIFFLRKSSRCKIDRLQSSEMFPFIFRSLYHVPHSPRLSQKIMAAADAVSRSSTCGVAWFTRDQVPLSFIRDLLGQDQ